MSFMNKIDTLKNKTPEELLEYFEMQSPPFDPFILADEIGVKVSTSIANWDKLGYDGEIFLNNDRIPEIWINPTHDENYQRFILAHQLGHLINDVLPNINNFEESIKDDYTTLSRSNKLDNKEYKANIFASKLLMPKNQILSEGTKAITAFIEEYGNDDESVLERFIEKMAFIFHVPKKAMQYRLEDLNILNNDEN